MRAKTLLFLFLYIANGGFSQNIVSTYAGTGMAGFKNGKIDTATFRHPFGICRDKNNNLFVADAENNCIRKINTTTGMVSTYAGTGVAGWKDGDAALAQFRTPTGVCADDAGNIYVADFENQRIRKISTSGQVSTIAGSGVAGYAEGNDTAAQFNYPRSICIDYLNNLYIADSWNHRIRKITASGVVSTYAGGGSAIGVQSIGDLRDGMDTAARFYTPSGVSIDVSGNIYVADAFNHRIRKIDTNREVSVLAGTSLTGPGNGGFADAHVSYASFNTPTELFIDDVTGNLYIGDTYNNRVRIISNSNVSTYAGNGTADYIDAVDTAAAFNYTRGVTMDLYGGKLYVVDYNNHAIRVVTMPEATGIAETNTEAPGIYPNPTTGIITFTSLPSAATAVEVYNTLGIKIAEPKLNANNADISNLPAGMYLLKLQGTSIAPKRILKLIP